MIWALETGIAYRSGRSAPPRIVSGRPSPLRSSKRAPISASGVVTRRIGRRRSEASPVSVARKRWPASRPSRSRVVVPELPQSSVRSGARSRPRLPTVTTWPSRSGEIATPSWRRTRAVDFASSDVSAPPT